MIDINKAKQKILDLAIRGKLTKQLKSDGSSADLFALIQKEKEKLIKDKKIKNDKNIINDEIEEPFEIPENWVWCKIGEIGIYKKGPFGSSLKKSLFVEKSKGTIKVYEQQNAIQHNSDLGKYYISKDYFDNKMKGFEVFSGDLIVSCAGTIGEIYLMPERIERGIINQALMKITLFKGINKQYFIKYFDYCLKQSASEGNGSAIINIPPFEVLKNYSMPLPPIAEQNRIVEKVEQLFDILDKIDEAQKKYQKDKEILKSKVIEAGIRGKLTKQLKSDGDAKGLYDKIQKEKEKLIKEGKIKRDKKETYIYKKSSDKLYYEKYQDGTEKCINDELPFKISDNWTWAKFSNVCDIATGTSIPKKVKADKYLGLNKGYCYIGTKDVGFDHKIIYENSVKIPKGEKGFEIASENSVLLCIEGGSAGRKIGIIDRDVCYGNKLCKFYSHSLNQRYIYYFLQSDTFKSIFKNNLTGLIEGVSISSINNLLIPLPPMKEQERIAKVIEKILSIINN